MLSEDYEQAQYLSSQVEQARQRAVLAASDAGASRDDARAAEQQAREYAKKAGLVVVNVDQAAQEAKDAADRAEAPTDSMVATLAGNPVSLTRAAVDQATGDMITTDGSTTQAAGDARWVTNATLSVAIGDQVEPISNAAVYVEKSLPAGWVSGGADGGAVAAACANGGRVILPPGKIVVEQTISPAKTLILEGAGSNFYGGAQAPTLLEFAGGVNGITLSGTAAVSSVIRDVHLAGTGGTGVGITINTGRVSIADIAVTGFGGHGILIQDPGNAHIIQTSGVISLRNNGGNGLHIIGQSNACTFIGLDIAHNGGWGIFNEGRSNEFIHPHILNNSAGAIWDNSIGNYYHFPYVEADVGSIKDKVIMGPSSTGGIYITGSYGPGNPVLQAAGGGDWTVIINGRQRRGLKLVPLGGPTAGNNWEADVSVYGTNVFRLRDATAGKDVLRATASEVTLPLPTKIVGGIRIPHETTAPGGVGGQAILFSRINGSGKTELCVRFPTGIVQVLSTES